MVAGIDATPTAPHRGGRRGGSDQRRGGSATVCPATSIATLPRN